MNDDDTFSIKTLSDEFGNEFNLIEITEEQFLQYEMEAEEHGFDVDQYIELSMRFDRDFGEDSDIQLK